VWDSYIKEVKKYTGYTPTKLEWEGCVGCQIPNQELPKQLQYNFLKGCKTRTCAFESNIQTCGHCTRFPCGNSVTERTGKNYTRETLEKKLGEPITDEAYEKYVSVFDAMTNIDEIRSTLKKGDFVEPMTVELKQSTRKQLPDTLQDVEHLQLYKTLSKILDSKHGVKNTDTIAGQDRLSSRREFITRLLWVIGLKGQMKETKMQISSIDLNEYRKKLKLPINEEGWKSVFSFLKPLGIQGSLEILTDKLYTPGGWMREVVPGTREAAYNLHLTFAKKLGQKFYDTLKEYVLALDKKHGKRSYSYFSKLDFQVLNT
jgi:hypothetical protein